MGGYSWMNIILKTFIEEDEKDNTCTFIAI
jgi:hypothetical protein